MDALNSALKHKPGPAGAEHRPGSDPVITIRAASHRLSGIRAPACRLLLLALLVACAAGRSLTVIPAGAAQQRVVQAVIVNNATSGRAVSVPIELVALGNEHALSFSLSFDPLLLSAPQLLRGSSARQAAFKFDGSQAAQGRFGITLTLPAGRTFVAGTQQVAVVVFSVAACSVGKATEIEFGDQPVVRSVRDTSANSLLTTYRPGAVAVTIPDPQPMLTLLGPNSAKVGGAAFTLAALGANFIPGSIVRWNGANRPTTFISATQLLARIPASDIGAQSTTSVTVFNPGPCGGASNALPFITRAVDPRPVLISISPNSAPVGSPAFTLKLTGINFVPQSVVRWNGSARATTFVSTTQLTAQIPASDLTTHGIAFITVFNPQVLNLQPAGSESNALFFVVNNLTISSAASYSSAEVATESIAVAFRHDAELAVRDESAATTPLPTEIAGTAIRVLDSMDASRLAPLFYVHPDQVNFQVPPGTEIGEATVTAWIGMMQVATGMVQVATVAPGIFTANASGSGVPSAQTLHVSAGSSVYRDVFEFSAGPPPMYVPRPIDLGLPTDQVFLVLYGTGIRFHGGLSNVTATIGGTAATVQAAQSAPGFVGTDQVNLLIPRSLAGRGLVNVILTVGGKMANSVEIRIR